MATYVFHLCVGVGGVFQAQCALATERNSKRAPFWSVAKPGDSGIPISLRLECSQRIPSLSIGCVCFLSRGLTWAIVDTTTGYEQGLYNHKLPCLCCSLSASKVQWENKVDLLGHNSISGQSLQEGVLLKDDKVEWTLRASNWLSILDHP